jgi:hypothetical protein
VDASLIIFIAPIAAVVVLALILVAVIVIWRKRRKTSAKFVDVEMKSASIRQSMDQTSFHSEERQIATHDPKVKSKRESVTKRDEKGIKEGMNSFHIITDIVREEKLGGGNFGEVYKGSWKGTPVALKALKDKDQIKEFEQEATVLQYHLHDSQFY